VVTARSTGAASDGSPLFDDSYPHTFSGGADGCPASGDAAPDNQDIRVNLFFLVIVERVGPFRWLTLSFRKIMPISHLLASYLDHAISFQAGICHKSEELSLFCQLSASINLGPGNFTGSLLLPVASLLQWPVKGDSPGTRAIVYAAAAIPALFRMQDNRGLAFVRIGYINIYLAYFDAMVAAIANFRIEDCRSIRCSYIGHSVYCFLSHDILLYFVQTPT
jgi:hypothetical protein